MKLTPRREAGVKKKLSVFVLGMFVLVAIMGIDLAGSKDSYGLDLKLDYTYKLYPIYIPHITDIDFTIHRKIAIYIDEGTNAESILAVFRAVAAMGHSVYGIGKGDIAHGRLNTDNFDVLILPPVEPNIKWPSYPAANYYNALGSALTLGVAGVVNDEIRNFVDDGGGFVGIQGGAYYACNNYPSYLNLYPAGYGTSYTGAGPVTATITHPDFTNGGTHTTQEAYMTAGLGDFATTPDTDVVATSGSANVIVKSDFNPDGDTNVGHVILTSLDLSLRGDSFDDWTIWDNIAFEDASETHDNSIGAWKLLGRMINWAAGGSASEPNLNSSNAPDAAYVAVISTHTSDGGASPKLLPAIGRSIEYAGHIPLAIRFEDVKNNELTTANFDAVVFPGGYAYGYKTGLSGHESKVLDFVSDGGGYLGICAGSYYAADFIFWDGSWYDYPLNLFTGYDIGPISKIAGLDGDSLTYALTPISVSDPVIGNLGTQQQLYYGGGYKWPIDGQATVATYDDYYGTSDAVRFTYGDGHVLLVGTHPEALVGSNEDWLFWDNYAYDSDTPLSNPDYPWGFVNAIFNNWLIF